MANARIIKLSDGRIELEAPYNPVFIDRIMQLPNNKRAWNKIRGRWEITADVLPDAKKILEESYEHVEETLG